MTKVLVTGGTGMLAQHVAEALMSRGAAVRLGDVAWPTERIWVSGCETATFDVRDVAACAEAVKGVDAVIHCAAVVGPARAKASARITLDVNVVGTANLLEACAASGIRLINVSTATLYGHRPLLEPLAETAAPEPLSLYDGSKQMAEVFCASHRKTYSSDVASFRTGFVYGRGNQIGEYFLPKVRRGEAVSEPAGADHPCDFSYVVDVAEGLVSAAMAPALVHDIYNLTGGKLHTREEFADAVRSVVPSASITLGKGIDPARHLRGACVLDRARQDFNWVPRFSLQQGVQDWARRLDEVER